MSKMCSRKENWREKKKKNPETSVAYSKMGLSRDVEARECAHGLGLFAKTAIPRGTVVWMHSADDPTATWTREEVAALPADAQVMLGRMMYQTGDNEFTSALELKQHPVSEWPTVVLNLQDKSFYMNHSCAPNTVWQSDDVVVAWRDIAADEQLTIDYSTSDDTDEGDSWQCNCGAPHCRRYVRGTDWQLPEMQERFKGHFTTYIQGLIDAQKQKQEQEEEEENKKAEASQVQQELEKQQ